MRRNLVPATLMLVLAAALARGQSVPSFDASHLLKPGDEVKYGSYIVIRLADGIYRLKDPGDPKAKAGGLIGVDMYLIRGTAKALLIDLGNNYIDGYPGDVIPPRKNAAEELLAVVDGLRGRLPLEVAITHAHPDHDGMTRAFLSRKTVLWMPQGEDLQAPKTQHGNIDPSVYTVFDHATKSFDLGGGRVVKPLLVRGHSNGCTAYLLAKDLMIFTGDSTGIGAGRSLRSAAALKVFAEDTQKLVEYLKANLSPYERHSLKVYTGHSVENPIAGFYSFNHPMLDLDWLDWRFIQDQALCANACVKGMWLVPDNGLRQMEVTNKQNGRRVNVMLYGVGAIEIPLEAVYEAAGLKMPQQDVARSPASAW
jgi:glyoxylase-like metal-dependent hydrolase (beta-lactamase superfamily II)